MNYGYRCAPPILRATGYGLNNLTGSVWGPTTVQTAPSATSVAFTYTYELR
jgi:hypothetical protein